jgi:O-antigen/teichoic acid export membrane protein
MHPDAARGETSRYRRSAIKLSAALGLAGALTYLFFGLASHSLDPDEYGEIVVLWTAVFLVAATLFRPIEHLLARTLAERLDAHDHYADALRAAAIIQFALCAVAVVVLLLAKGPIQGNLFSDEPDLFWAMLGALVGYSFAYFARGLLAGRGLFSLYAALLLCEVLLRLAAVVLVAVGIASGTLPVAVGIALAPLAGLIFIPVGLLWQRATPAAPTQDRLVPELTLGSGGTFTVAVLVMMLSEQVLLNSGALFVRAAEGAAAAGFIFNVMMVARAPVVLFQAVAASLLPHLARLRARGDEASAEAFRHSLTTTVMAVAAFATATTLGVLAVGPEVMKLAFGGDFDYDRLGLAIVAVGMGLYLTAVSLNQAVIAQGRALRASVPWLGSALLFAGLNLWQPLSPFRTVELGFTLSAGMLAALLYLVYATSPGEVEEPVKPGSSAELEATLASIDEVG